MGGWQIRQSRTRKYVARTRKYVGRVISVGLVMSLLWSTDSAAFVDKSSATVAQVMASPGTVKIPVYVLVYGVPFIDIEKQTLSIMSYLERGTMYHGMGTPYLDFEIYTIATAKPVIVPTLPNSEEADYEAIYFENGVEDLCAVARQGKSEQVWVWKNNAGGNMQETVDNGPLWKDRRGTNVPDCGIQVTTASHNVNRAVEYAVEAHIHRYERFFKTHFAYVFNKKSTIPYSPPGAQCRGSAAGDLWGWCVDRILWCHRRQCKRVYGGRTRCAGHRAVWLGALPAEHHLGISPGTWGRQPLYLRLHRECVEQLRELAARRR
ncbi:MAG: hypothetical protein JXA33_27560 [Anaerolineae bacterium]|nr:hypothetical protein [Anaerolineae bacterium]